MLLLQSSFVRWIPTFCLLVNVVRCTSVRLTPHYKDKTIRQHQQQQQQQYLANSPHQTTATSSSQVNTAQQTLQDVSTEGREINYGSKPEAENIQIISDRSGLARPLNFADNSQLTRPVKRIVGLFRCSGWGPSCSGGGGGQNSAGGYSVSSANVFNSPATDKLLMQNQSSRRRKHQRSYDQIHKLAYQQQQQQQQLSQPQQQQPQPQPQLSIASAASTQGRSSSARRQAMKFEPFFTLTSGGSWGPAGRKRKR